MEFIKRIHRELAKVFAQLYNSLPEDTKALIYNASSVLVSTVGLLALSDAKTIVDGLSNPYLIALGVFLITVLSAIINLLQKKLVDLGTRKLAAEGDKQTLNVLSQKINKTKRIIQG